MTSKRGTIVPIVVAWILMALGVNARPKDESEREEMYRRYLDFSKYVKGGTVEPHWMADGNSFWYAEGASENTVIWKVDPEANTKTPFLDTPRILKLLGDAIGKELPHKGIPFDEFAFTDDTESAIRFSVGEKEFVLKLRGYEIAQAEATGVARRGLVPQTIPQPAYRRFSWAQVKEIPSPDGRWFAGLRKHNIWLRSASDGRIIQLTEDGSPEHDWWDWPWKKQLAWSPDNRKLASGRMDLRRVPKLPLVDFLKPIEEVQWSPRWLDSELAGEPMPQQAVYIFDIASKRRVSIDLRKKQDRRIEILTWTNDSSELLLLISDRYRLELDIFAADAKTGSTRRLLHEVHGAPRYSFNRFTVLPSGKGFIWLSEKDGWRHAYLYDLEGTLVQRLTKGRFVVERAVEVDEKRGWVYFLARGDPHRIYDTHLYRVSLDGQNLTQLTEATGQHEVRFAPSKQFFLDMHSTVDRPPRVELRRANGPLLRTLTEADIDGLKKLGWKPPEEFVVKAADGKTDIHGILYKPHDFDVQKKYPVIEHLYPVVTRVPRSFLPGSEKEHPHVWCQAMAQLGFLAMVIDTRGSTGRATNFSDMLYRNTGRYEIRDRVTALKQLAEKYPYFDLSRVGVIGYSNGGYYAIRALLEAPETYHVGIAVAPVVDRGAHISHIWLGPPADNKDAFELASLFRLVPNLKGKLLLIHGTHDRLVPVSHTMRIVDALTRANRPYDLMIVPDWGHWEGYEWEDHRLETYRRYFIEHLKP